MEEEKEEGRRRAGGGPEEGRRRWSERQRVSSVDGTRNKSVSIRTSQSGVCLFSVNEISFPGNKPLVFGIYHLSWSW